MTSIADLRPAILSAVAAILLSATCIAGVAAPVHAAPAPHTAR